MYNLIIIQFGLFTQLKTAVKQEWFLKTHLRPQVDWNEYYKPQIHKFSLKKDKKLDSGAVDGSKIKSQVEKS